MEVKLYVCMDVTMVLGEISVWDGMSIGISMKDIRDLGWKHCK